mmetsp:Transcript_3742/g.6013  ORF Transcript_3742/g.6013 Transcript_3742/m.6013 type:complete len:221 (-) Transcript_3742:356-1018(-)
MTHAMHTKKETTRVVGLHQFPVDNVGSQQFRHLHKICVHKVFKVLHTKLEMITGRGLKIHTASFVQCLQPKGVFQIPHGLIHGKECGLRVVCEEPKPFGIPRLNHGVLQCLDQHQFLELHEVVFVCLVLCWALVVDIWQKFALLHIFWDAQRVTEVICLCKRPLGNIRIRQYPKETVEQATYFQPIVTAGESCNSHHRPMHRQESFDRGCIVALDVTPDN